MSTDEQVRQEATARYGMHKELAKDQHMAEYTALGAMQRIAGDKYEQITMGRKANPAYHAQKEAEAATQIEKAEMLSDMVEKQASESGKFADQNHETLVAQAKQDAEAQGITVNPINLDQPKA